MRKCSWALVFLFFISSLALQARPVDAAWEGTHRFSLAVMGSVTTMDQLASTSQSVPLEMRATVVVTVDAPNASGEYSGRLRLLDVTVHQDGEVLSLPMPQAGYRIRLHRNRPHEVLEDAGAMADLGLNLQEILAMLFPVPPGQALTEEASWSREYTQSLEVNGIQLNIPMRNTFAINEVRDSIVVVQSSLRGSASRDLNPGRLTSDQLGTGFLHVDPATGDLIRSAVTVRTTIERTIPIGAVIPQERFLLRALITTSVERLQLEPTVIPSLGAEYVDPAGRFKLRLPEGWSTEPFQIDRTLTLFASPDGRSQLFVDMAPADRVQSSADLAEVMLDHFGRLLVNFSVSMPPASASLGGHPATLTVYRYFDRVEMVESALFAQIDGYNVALQLAQEEGYGTDATELLRLLADQFSLGPTPEGKVAAEQLILSPTILYEGREHAFDIEIPMLWPYVETQDGSVTFIELGGAGRTNIHIEVVSPNDAPADLLEQWVRRLESMDSDIRVVSPVQQDALGPLSAASTLVDFDLDGRTYRSKIVAANLEGLLYVVVVGYEAEGFEARQAVIERIFSGFRPRPDYLAAQQSVFDAYTPPPLPAGEQPFLMLGRILHEVDGLTQPAAGVRVEFSVNDHTYAAVTDSEGFYYVANLPVRSSDVVTLEAVRGSLFGLPYDVSITLSGLSLIVEGQVGLVPELIFGLQPGNQVAIDLDDGIDRENRQSRIHQAFLNRFPDSPWSELVRQDMEARLEQ